MTRILITGARSWENAAPIRAALRKLAPTKSKARKLLLITGGAPGVDTIAAFEARKLGIHVAEVRALWDSYGRGAGPMRNGVMIALDPLLVVAFHWDLENESKGTKRCIEQARAKGTPVKIVLVPRDVAMPSAKAHRKT